MELKQSNLRKLIEHSIDAQIAELWTRHADQQDDQEKGIGSLF